MKYDGASISITYENAKHKRAVTRGDGFQGYDITHNVKTIKSVPLNLKESYMDEFEIRGEIILPLKGFEKMNQELIEIGETPYSNPRNTASGSLKLQRSEEHTSELQSRENLVCRLLLEKKKYNRFAL